MLIRSQDKETLINFNNSIVVNTMVDIGGVTKMFCSYSCDDYGEIVGNGLAGSAYTGSYDTKESVAHGIAVLKGYGNEIRKSILFQMPEDSEVEV